MQNRNGQSDFIVVLAIFGAIVGGIIGFKIGGYGGILSGIVIGPAILIPCAGLIAAGLEALLGILIFALVVAGIIYYLRLTYSYWGVGKETAHPNTNITTPSVKPDNPPPHVESSTPENTSSRTFVEKCYENKLKLFIENDNVLDSNERGLLNQARKRYELSEKRCKEIEQSLPEFKEVSSPTAIHQNVKDEPADLKSDLNSLTQLEKEKIYCERVSFFIKDDQIIDEKKERKNLDGFRNKLGLKVETCQELEKTVIAQQENIFATKNRIAKPEAEALPRKIKEENSAFPEGISNSTQTNENLSKMPAIENYFLNAESKVFSQPSKILNSSNTNTIPSDSLSQGNSIINKASGVNETVSPTVQIQTKAEVLPKSHEQSGASDAAKIVSSISNKIMNQNLERNEQKNNSKHESNPIGWLVVNSFLLFFLWLFYKYFLQFNEEIAATSSPTLKFLKKLFRFIIFFPPLFFLFWVMSISIFGDWAGTVVIAFLLTIGLELQMGKEFFRFVLNQYDGFNEDVSKSKKIESLSLISKFPNDSPREETTFSPEKVVEKKEMFDRTNFSLEKSVYPTMELSTFSAQNGPFKMELTQKLSESEKDYLEEMTTLAVEGALNDKALEILKRRQKKLGLTDDQCKRLRSFVCAGSFSPAEKEYLEEVKFFLEDDKKIDDTERKSLNRIQTKLGLSDRRCQELEEIVIWILNKIEAEKQKNSR
ncbi:MAG: hypothetical protein HQM08_28105 [Candidatus Riflebacteria bacterium]|nr:hypothetical protein [Candidatus Riflebacteria bacterium]